MGRKSIVINVAALFKEFKEDATLLNALDLFGLMAKMIYGIFVEKK